MSLRTELYNLPVSPYNSDSVWWVSVVSYVKYTFIRSLGKTVITPPKRNLSEILYTFLSHRDKMNFTGWLLLTDFEKKVYVNPKIYVSH